MQRYTFIISQDELDILKLNSKEGKNSDIGKMAVEVVRLYFLRQNPNTKFIIGKKNEPDITVESNGVIKSYEVKGTEGDKIAYHKLKISSKYCFEELKKGMEIIRVTNLRSCEMSIHFLKHGEDFLMVPEDRWAIKKIK